MASELVIDDWQMITDDDGVERAVFTVTYVLPATVQVEPGRPLVIDWDRSPLREVAVRIDDVTYPAHVVTRSRLRLAQQRLEGAVDP